MLTEHLSLFLSSFISSTLFPGGSEALLIYFSHQQPDWILSLLVVATIGNTLGAIVTYLMGYYINAGRRATKRKHIKSWLLCKKYGVWSLLLSWLPIIGDILPLFAGWLKLPMILSWLLILTGKLLRYSLLLFIVI